MLAETVPRQTQRLYHLVDQAKPNIDLSERLVAAEEAIYASKSDPMVNWDVEDLKLAFEAAGLVVEVINEQTSSQLHITSTLLERWFAPTNPKKERPTYAQHLAHFLKPAELKTVQDLFTRCLLNQTVSWSNTIAFVRASAVL